MKNVFADFLLLGGTAAVVYGVSLIWLPGACILGGVALAVLAVVTSGKVPQSPGVAGSPP
jgi:hypothetical protein